MNGQQPKGFGPSESKNGDGEVFLDAYEVTNLDALEWEVTPYRFQLQGLEKARHEDRSSIVDAMWELRRQHGERCKGWGFVVPVDEQTVVVPARWVLPTGLTIANYYISSSEPFVARASVPQHHRIVIGIIKEAVKKHFKDGSCGDLGFLWQDYGAFCQMPSEAEDEEACFCRRFTVLPVSLNGTLVLHFIVSTTAIDALTMESYYSKGEVDLLADRIREKQGDKTTRTGERPAVRVWYDVRAPHQDSAMVMELVDPDEVVQHGSLPPDRQRELAPEPVICRRFRKAPEAIPKGSIRLILDTEITGELHSETIISPAERFRYVEKLRDYFHGFTVYGSRVDLAIKPLATHGFSVEQMLPPPIKVKGPSGKVEVIEAPETLDEESLTRRARRRAACIRRNGFLLDRPVNPVLAWPKTGNPEGLVRMTDDINRILGKRRVEYRFGAITYANAEDLRRKVEQDGYDTLLAVLPPETGGGIARSDMHEEIKRRVDIPSQCIHLRNTLPRKWITQSRQTLCEKDPALERRVTNRYELCVDNLLVKHGWVPFVPATSFNYNVHIGLDVGGKSNNRVVACMAYGLSQPDKDLCFRVHEIPVDIQKAEPVPTRSLFAGLRELFDLMKTELDTLGQTADFDKVLFIRDGAMLGCADEWNERDAIETLWREFVDARIISSDSVWSVAEILKRAERWRVFANGATITNPLVGYSLLNFGGEDEALVCTTGRPYLSQGTANPMRVRASSIAGPVVLRSVIRDLVWEADMGFTKPDMGRGLPWVLHIADTGALQLSRSYRISGITA